MSGEPIGIHNVGNWTAGKNGSCVVSDKPGGNVPGGDTFDEYYGGYLIAESIGRSNVPIVTAAPDMLNALVAVREAIRGWNVSFAWELTRINFAIAKATTPIPPVQQPPVVPETAVKYEDIDQHDVFIAGDQYQDVGNGSDRWMNVEVNIGCTRSQSSLHDIPCRRPVRQSPVEPVPESAYDTEKAKPPIGIMPWRLWMESRLEDVYAAVGRYREAKLAVPPEWLSELAEIEDVLQSDCEMPF